MPYAPFRRLTVSGSFGTGTGLTPERWSYGVSLTQPPVISEDGQVADFGRFVTNVQDFHGRANSYFWAGCVLDQIKLARIGADGKYLSDAREWLGSRPGAAVGAVPNFPFQVCIVASMQSARRGSTGRGRCFLPLPQLTLQADGTVNDGQRTTIESSFKIFIDSLNTNSRLAGAGEGVIVASSKGYNSPVTAVRIGDVMDTMRSRRRGLSEGTTAPLAVA